MRRFACAAVLVLAACQGPDSEINPSVVQWMDWPAEVRAAQPFAVRLIVTQPCVARGFRDGLSADESAITFAPYFLEVNEEVLCVAPLNLTIGALDTTVMTPGLAATFARTYEVRAAAYVHAPASLMSLPIRTFGQVVVRLEDPGTARRNGAGFASVLFDNAGCRRLYPTGLYQPEDLVPLADQEQGPVSVGFVRGYFEDAPAPVCGETRVFHLVGEN